jgi:hypothetical protein
MALEPRLHASFFAIRLSKLSRTLIAHIYELLVVHIGSY